MSIHHIADTRDKQIRMRQPEAPRARCRVDSVDENAVRRGPSTDSAASRIPDHIRFKNAIFEPDWILHARPATQNAAL